MGAECCSHSWRTIMAHVVSPFLEEIIQFLDFRVCEDHSEFAKLHYDFRVFAALIILSTAGLAKSKTRPGRGESWTPTRKLLGLLGNPPKKPDFPSYRRLRRNDARRGGSIGIGIRAGIRRFVA